ncbi:site-2 protease family protein [Mesotoga sp. Brook.08.YT.4.2.5.1]|uniref:site-2 protease family protein n=1 Tax=Mesotoga sp. Brook.08.YT.4.2.5.1 TaxID=1421001 RepID=UPI00215540C1|nr:site-2 protease family protein [Mesotoga sp. Brook.08.YT.4.2.5.1]
MLLAIVYFLLILTGIVVVHELGHYLFSRVFGVRVLEFAIGMGPKLWSKKRKKDYIQDKRISNWRLRETCRRRPRCYRLLRSG